MLQPGALLNGPCWENRYLSQFYPIATSLFHPFLFICFGFFHVLLILLFLFFSNTPLSIHPPPITRFEYSSAVQPAARMRPADWFHAARQCWLNLLEKKKIMCKKSSKRQNLSWHLTISTQIQFFKFIKYTILNTQVRENVMECNQITISSFKSAMLSNGISAWVSIQDSLKSSLRLDRWQG